MDGLACSVTTGPSRAANVIQWLSIYRLNVVTVEARNTITPDLIRDFGAALAGSLQLLTESASRREIEVFGILGISKKNRLSLWIVDVLLRRNTLPSHLPGDHHISITATAQQRDT